MENKKQTFLFSKRNYVLLLTGILLNIIGFILMSGGGSNDPNIFNEEIFSFQRITLAPVLVFSGYGFVFWSILKKDKK
jgi:hypothetical protein